jgi:hypothetical protein
MPDQLYLSLWLNGFIQHNMLRHYEKLLRLFPVSLLARNPSVFKVIAVADSEPPVFERAYPPPVDPDDVLVAAREFQHPDSSYRFEAWWDLWQYEEDWKVLPARVELCCFGPGFENDWGDNLRVEFGIDTHFLPQPDLPDNYGMTQSNIKSLLKLVHDLDDALNVAKRQLWTDSGENFAEKLQAHLTQ